MAKLTFKPGFLAALGRHNLNKVPDDQFNQMSFCGTARCLFGHAPEVAILYKWGLRYDVTDDVYITKTRLNKMFDQGLIDVNRVYPYNWKEGDKSPAMKRKLVNSLYDQIKNYDTFLAAELVFGITRREAKSLFGANVGSRASLAAAVLNFVEWKKKVTANA